MANWFHGLPGIVIVLCGRVSACDAPAVEAPAPAPAAETKISVQLARKLAVDRYRQLFSNRYWRNVDGSYQEFPPLEETSFVVEEDGDAFVVTCAPLRGYHVQARVARTGAWVELVNVGYAAH